MPRQRATGVGRHWPPSGGGGSPSLHGPWAGLRATQPSGGGVMATTAKAAKKHFHTTPLTKNSLEGSCQKELICCFCCCAPPAPCAAPGSGGFRQAGIGLSRATALRDAGGYLCHPMCANCFCCHLASQVVHRVELPAHAMERAEYHAIGRKIGNWLGQDLVRGRILPQDASQTLVPALAGSVTLPVAVPRPPRRPVLREIREAHRGR